MKFPILVLLLGVVALRGDQDLIAEIQQMAVAGKLVEAQSALAEALKTQKADARLWNLMGVVSAQLNDIGAAEESFKQAVHLAPKLESAWLNLGRLYQVSSNDRESIDKSLTAYETVLRLNPASGEAHHQLALLLFLTQKYSSSLAHLNRLPSADQSRRAALILRCADEAALANTPKALELARQILLDPGLEQVDVLPVLPAITSHNDAVAFRILEGLDKRNLCTDGTLRQLAAAYERRADWKRARETYERIARSKTDDVQPLMDLARVSWQQKDFEGTLGYLAHARDLDPPNAAIHFLFGISCNELRLPVEAKQSLEKALALEPENAYYNYAMGSMLLQWTDKSRAISYLEKFVSLRPGDPRGHLALATAYAGAGHPREARAQLAIPLKDATTLAGAAYLLGSLAREEGDTDAAIRHLRRVIELEPKSPEAHAELGSLLLGRDEVGAARRETELALAMDPRSYRANATLMKLYRDAHDPRLEAQVELLKKLAKEREAEFQLLHRTIEFQPR